MGSTLSFAEGTHPGGKELTSVLRHNLGGHAVTRQGSINSPRVARAAAVSMSGSPPRHPASHLYLNSISGTGATVASGVGTHAQNNAISSGIMTSSAEIASSHLDLGLHWDGEDYIAEARQTSRPHLAQGGVHTTPLHKDKSRGSIVGTAGLTVNIQTSSPLSQVVTSVDGSGSMTGSSAGSAIHGSNKTSSQAINSNTNVSLTASTSLAPASQRPRRFSNFSLPDKEIKQPLRSASVHSPSPSSRKANKASLTSNWLNNQLSQRMSSQLGVHGPQGQPGLNASVRMRELSPDDDDDVESEVSDASKNDSSKSSTGDGAVASALRRAQTETERRGSKPRTDDVLASNGDDGGDGGAGGVDSHLSSNMRPIGPMDGTNTYTKPPILDPRTVITITDLGDVGPTGATTTTSSLYESPSSATDSSRYMSTTLTPPPSHGLFSFSHVIQRKGHQLTAPIGNALMFSRSGDINASAFSGGGGGGSHVGRQHSNIVVEESGGGGTLASSFMSFWSRLSMGKSGGGKDRERDKEDQDGSQRVDIATDEALAGIKLRDEDISIDMHTSSDTGSGASGGGTDGLQVPNYTSAPPVTGNGRSSEYIKQSSSRLKSQKHSPSTSRSHSRPESRGQSTKKLQEKTVENAVVIGSSPPVGPYTSATNPEKVKKVEVPVVVAPRIAFFKKLVWHVLFRPYAGSEEDLADEEKVDRFKYTYGIHPESWFSMIWKLFMIVVYVIALWGVPFIIGFGVMQNVTEAAIA
ncbi:hypothetical protein HDU76_004411 [Blyttiomyces sp. JEL0837]|nr:hypothetical protein HDU76_004411 [Blyttiomyces sp. JEL0837]